MTGRPLRWTQHQDGSWTATGRDGTHWEIRRFGLGADREFGITVAHWDHPDWWAPTLERAQELVAEIDARPPVPREDGVVEREVVEPPRGEELVAWPTSTPPPEEPCPVCGTRRAAEAVKPARESAAWWTDPSPFWRCPDCGRERGDVDEWPYDISRQELVDTLDLLAPPPPPGRPSRRRRWWRRRADD